MSGFFDDLQSNIGMILNPVQAGLATAGLQAPQYDQALGALPGLGQATGTQNNFQATLAPITNTVTPEQIIQAGQQYQSQIPDQQALQQMLLQQAQGNGPNPAQNMLNQATGQNVSNQAALMAGQRGASANTGLITRQAGQAGAGIQQQAAGQAATLGAQQQLGAMGQLQNQQALQQQGALNNQGQLLGAQGAFNNAQVGNYGGVNTANANVSMGNQKNNQALVGGALSGIGALLPMLGGGGGGELLAGGGGLASGASGGLAGGAGLLFNKGGQVPDHLGHVANCYYGGGEVNAMVSPGEKYVNPQDAKMVASGQKSLGQAGQQIPGKAQVGGDSKKNDTVPTKLEAGGIVIPRSISQSPNAANNAAKFVAAVLAKQGLKKKAK